MRKEAMLADAVVSPAVFRGAVERLENFVQPFAECLIRREQVQHAMDFVMGLVTDLDRKNTESIAYRHDQDRKDLQHFIGQSNWDCHPLQMELARQVGRDLGCPNGVLVFDPSGFPKKGTASVGVQRQWCGRLGKVDNCQVGIYMAYVSDTEHALVNTRLYLPKDWAQDKKRRKQCHVPKEVRFRTRAELCCEMLDESASLLPHRCRTVELRTKETGWALQRTRSVQTRVPTQSVGTRMQSVGTRMQSVEARSRASECW